MKDDPFGEFDGPEPTPDDFDAAAKLQWQQHRSKMRTRARLRNARHNIPEQKPLSQEILDARNHYSNDYVAMHQEIFKNSTGLKPYGPYQIKSIEMTQRILTNGGKGVKAEPRGYAKTSRTTNEALMAVLQGKINYPIVLASSTTKAVEILDSMKTELVQNEKLAELYPIICECFRSLEGNNRNAAYQTYNGQPTYIQSTNVLISFPVIPGEPSSGAVIQVRPKDNVRGIAHRPQEGPLKGRVIRPDFAFFDDIQTDEEANNPNVVRKIVRTLKKSVMRAGTHSKPLSAIMCCTPIALDDVSCHYLFEEPTWERIMYSMLTEPPINLDWWLGPYAEIRTTFDRDTPGASIQARIDACKLYQANRALADDGAQVSWDWAYAWDEDPQTEVSAIQHAMNILIDEGRDVFETECQCNVTYLQQQQEDRVAEVKIICEKQHHLPRGIIPKAHKDIVTHIDIGNNILTWCTVSACAPAEPHIIDYGTYPEQPRNWDKGKLPRPLSREYPDIEQVERRILVALKDLLNHLSQTTYLREDGVKLQHSLILADASYLPEYVYQACREVPTSSICFPCYGQFYDAKANPLSNKSYRQGSTKHWYCVTALADKRNELSLLVDVNHYKSQVHRGLLTPLNLPGSISLFQDEPGHHTLFARHCNAEYPEDDKDEKSGRTKVLWHQHRARDNEYFDNLVGCLAGLSKLGIPFDTERRRHQQPTFDISEYMNKATSTPLQL